MLTVTKVKNSTTAAKDQIFMILDSASWEDCKQEVKEIYNSIKNELNEEQQEELKLYIFMETMCYDDYTSYWNFMSR